MPDLDLEASDILEAAIPMVCFCDVRLTHAGRHLDTYGRYGVGLTKRWGLANGVTPVLYSHPRSMSTLELFRIAARLSKHAKNHEEVRELFDSREVQGDLDRAFSIVKPSIKAGSGEAVSEIEKRSGSMTNGSGAGYLPDPIRSGLSGKSGRIRERLAEVHRIISLQHPLRFEANDVRYLVVQGEDDVVPLLGALKRRAIG